MPQSQMKNSSFKRMEVHKLAPFYVCVFISIIESTHVCENIPNLGFYCYFENLESFCFASHSI